MFLILRGMTPEETERFQTVYTKGETSTRHGLGLSVCMELAAANDMKLTIPSIPGRGTLFRLSLAAYAA